MADFNRDVRAQRRAGRERPDLRGGSAGQIMGMFDEFRPAADILHDIVEQAAEVIEERLAPRVFSFA